MGDECNKYDFDVLRATLARCLLHVHARVPPQCCSNIKWASNVCDNCTAHSTSAASHVRCVLGQAWLMPAENEAIDRALSAAMQQ